MDSGCFLLFVSPRPVLPRLLVLVESSSKSRPSSLVPECRRTPGRMSTDDQAPRDAPGGSAGRSHQSREASAEDVGLNLKEFITNEI